MRSRQLLKMCLLFASAWTFAYGEADSNLEITIHVYDYGGIDLRELTEAETIAARIFQKSGLRILWGNCRLPPTGTALTKCAASDGGPTHLYIRLLPEQMAQKLTAAAKMLGMSVPTYDGTFPMDAYVFAERIGDLAKQDRGPVPPLLGAAIAHEVGHLLLAGNAHTVTGIMGAQWGPKENKDALMGVLTFSRLQSRKMRFDVSQRMSGSNQRSLAFPVRDRR